MEQICRIYTCYRLRCQKSFRQSRQVWKPRPYMFRNQFRFLNDQEVEQYINMETFEFWSKAIDESEWG